jgi:hypothetical protein
MTAYLIEHPPVQRQFRERGAKPTGLLVVHTAESTPDWVDHDTGAEGVARFIQGRADFGSYHLLVDSDSIVLLVPFHLQAYGDRTGSNPVAIHVSAATQAAKWAAAPADWRRETVRNMAEAAARAARWLKAEHGVTVPAKRITKAQSDAGQPGFISHGDRDPGRRSDPGAGFPWHTFLDDFAEAMRPAAPTPSITAALESTGDERRAALRRVVRRGAPEAQAAAEKWLRGITQREKALEKIEAGRKSLQALEVKEARRG